jgi:hypothetical protein
LSFVAALSTVQAVPSACLPADVTIDKAHRSLELSLRLPEGIDRLRFESLAPYKRTGLWQSPDRSAVIDDDSIAPRDPSHRQLRVRIDVGKPIVRMDRSYAPFQRFADGTVAIYDPQFAVASSSPLKLCTRYKPADGDQIIGFGKVQVTPLVSPTPWPPGYVAFGRPRIVRRGSLLLVSDRKTPAWIGESAMRDVPAITDMYTAALGPGDIPTVFLFMRPEIKGALEFNGDHLPGSLTLALSGSGWNIPDEPTRQRLLGFLAHELFHTWNSAPSLGSPEGEALLAKEGGAEYARMVATAHVRGGDDNVLAAVSQSLNACQSRIPATVSLRQALDRRDPGQLPYECGVPLMQVLATAADRDHPVQGYFRLWRKLAARPASAHPTYDWQDLIAPDMPAALRVTLEHTVATPGAYVEGIVDALRALGFTVSRPTSFDAGDRQRYAAKLLGELMHQDCGSISFWTEPDGFLLDKPMPTCRSLVPGAKVVAIQQLALAQADPRKVFAAVAERCARGDTVTIGYAAPTAPSELRCNGTPSAPSVPWSIAAPVH